MIMIMIVIMIISTSGPGSYSDPIWKMGPGPTWWAVSVTKGSVGIAIGWRVVGNVKIMASSKSRSIRRAVV